MRALFAFLIAFAVLPACAADRYVRQGAAGNGSGSDWTNAYPTLPATLVRGDTYYLADGSYGSYTFDDNASGTSVIRIKKCSTTDGVSSGVAGYSSTFCDGQAVFGDLFFTRPYYEITGTYRNESNWKDHAAYGIQATAVRASRLDGGHSPPEQCSADNLTFRYMHVGAETTSYATNTGSRSFYLGGFGGGATACQNWTISRVLIQNTYELQCAGGEGLLVEYTHFYIGWSKEAIRGQVHCSNAIVRFSVFEDSCQNNPTSNPPDGCTAEIGVWDGAAGSMDNWQVYGNVFFKTTTELNSEAVIFIGYGPAPGPLSANSVAHNNTIVGFRNWNADISLNGPGTACYNNLWYDNTGSATGCNTTGANNRVVGSNPFVNYAGRDFRLSGSASTSGGTPLSSPYNVDLSGNARGADGSWDVGAYEYNPGGGQPAALPAPTNLRVVP